MASHCEKLALISSLFGTSLFALYIHFNPAEPIWAVLSVGLLIGPATFFVAGDSTPRTEIWLISTVVGVTQSLWLLGNGYVQGTDGPVHLARATQFLQSSSVEIYAPGESLSAQAVNLYFLTSAQAHITGLSVNTSQLILTPIFGLSTILLFYIVVGRMLGTRTAVYSSFILVSSLTFIQLGNEIRTGTMAIPILLLLLFSLWRHHKNQEVGWFVYSILLLSTLVFTHILYTAHFLAIGILMFAVVHVHESTQLTDSTSPIRLTVPLLTIVLVFTISTYVLGTFGSGVSTVIEALFGVYSVSQGSVGPSSSNAATGTGAGLFVSFSVWFSRLLFILSATFVGVRYLIMFRKRNASVFDGAILTNGSVYLFIVVSVMVAGNAVGLNAGRIYRVFEFFAAIIIARALTLLPAYIPPVRRIKGLMLAGVVIILLVGSLATIPIWSIDMGLRSGGERPYLDFNSDDSATAGFAGQHMSNEQVIYGGGRSNKLFGTYSDQDVYQFKHYPPNSSEVSSKRWLCYYDRRDGGQGIVYRDSFVNRSSTIYASGGNYLNCAPGKTFAGNVSAE